MKHAIIIKDILSQNENFLKYFFILYKIIFLLFNYIIIIMVLYSPVNLLTHNIYALFERLKQYFTCFDCSIILCAILSSCGIACPITHAETGVTASDQVLGRINK